MTDTTDTKALRTLSLQRVKEIANGDSMLMGERVDLANTAILLHKELDVALDAFKNAATELFSAQEQLEAERQRADAAHKYGSERDSENESLMLTVGRLRVEITELKGDQKPVGEVEVVGGVVMAELYQPLPEGTELFTAPQKPVVLPDEMREDILRCVDEAMTGCNSLSAPDYAVRVAGWLSVGGVVKDGE